MGSCLGMDPGLFFKEGRPSQRVRDICEGCPVKQRCLEWAVLHDEFGMWGGTTKSERQRLETFLLPALVKREVKGGRLTEQEGRRILKLRLELDDRSEILSSLLSA
jgi:hypothetical protein